MKNAQDNVWDDAGFDALPLNPDPQSDMPLFYEDSKILLDWCGRGTACLCSAGASHLMCFVIPAVTGGLSGGVGALFSAGAMYVLSPAFAIAANAGIDRWKGIKRDIKRQTASMAVSTCVAVSLTFGINALMGHEHIDSSRRAYLDSLGAERRAAELIVPQQRYARLPPVLKQGVDAASRKDGLTAAEYMYFCDGSDALGQEISVFERGLQQREAAGPTP